MKTTIAIFFLALSLNCHARIGETLEESVARYGPVVKEGVNGTIFKKGDFDIKVHFYNGKTDFLTIIKDPSCPIQDFTPEELESLLIANFNGMKYSNHIEPNKCLYMTAFGALAACYDTKDKSLVIMSDDYVNRSKQEKVARGETRPAPTPAATSGF